MRSLLILALLLMPMGCKWWQRHRRARMVPVGASAYPAGSAQSRLDVQLDEHRASLDSCLWEATRRYPIEREVGTIKYRVHPDGHAEMVSMYYRELAPEIALCFKGHIESMTFHNPPTAPMTLVRRWNLRRVP